MKDIYIVIGGNGFLGNNIVRLLQDKNVNIRCLVYKKSDALSNLKCDIYYGDVKDKESLKGIFDVPKNSNVYVIHLASIIYIKDKFNKNVYNTNINGTINVVHYTKKVNAKLVYVSSVYSLPYEENKVIKEISYFNLDNQDGLYAYTKAKMNNYILNECKNGLKANIVMPSSLVGPHDLNNSFVNYYIKLINKHRLPLTIKGGYDFVDVRDVGKAIINLFNSDKFGEIYILSNRYYSLKELTNILYKIKGRKPIKLEVSTFFLKVITLIHETKLITKLSLKILKQKPNFSHEKATRLLDFNPRSMEETLKDMINE